MISKTRAISFMTANFVARENGWRINGWGEGDRTTNDAFRPVETFPQRFEELLLEARALGFAAIDLWQAHLNPDWATDAHLAAARELLERHDVRVTSFAGSFGDLERACDVADALGTTLLAGPTPLKKDRGLALAILRERGCRLAIENHPERTPQEMLDQIGADAGTVGTTLDTGWWGTRAYDPVRAIEELAPHVFSVHLKDVLAPGAHETCRWGEGVVPIERCVRRLRQLGYEGAWTVEHEPEDFDPREDIRAMREQLEAWLA
jgi:sugar phosphate isomerase/epimerase